MLTASVRDVDMYSSLPVPVPVPIPLGVPFPPPLSHPYPAPPSLCRSASSSSISSEDTTLSTESNNTSIDSCENVCVAVNSKPSTGADAKENVPAQTAASAGAPPSRRTRRRFTSVQLMMLEQLYHQNSHPTREQRETLAAQLNAYVSPILWRNAVGVYINVTCFDRNKIGRAHV